MEVLESIAKAEAEAAEIIKHAEKSVRSIEARNYAEIQKMRNELSLKTSQTIKTMEQEHFNQLHQQAGTSIVNPDKGKIEEAKKLIVSFIIGGAS